MCPVTTVSSAPSTIGVQTELVRELPMSVTIELTVPLTPVMKPFVSVLILPMILCVMLRNVKVQNVTPFAAVSSPTSLLAAETVKSNPANNAIRQILECNVPKGKFVIGSVTANLFKIALEGQITSAQEDVR